MSLKCCVFLLLGCTSAVAEIEPIQRDWVLVSQPLKWRSPPRKVHSSTKYAAADLIVLNPTGSFAQLFCVLYRQHNGDITISRGDSHSLRVGKWTIVGTVLSAKDRLVYADALPIGKPVPGPEMTREFELLSRDGSGWLVQSGKTFKPLAGLSDLEFLAAVISCDRSFWNGSQWQDTALQPCMR